MKKWKWHKIKSKIKNLFLISTLIFAGLIFIASLQSLMEYSLRSLLWFVLSVAWIVLFGHANGWMQECP